MNSQYLASSLPIVTSQISAQIVFALATIIILCIIFFFYLFHLVGKFTQSIWLLCEFYLYFTFTIFYFINTIIIFLSEKELIRQGFICIFIVLNFFVLALTKLMMIRFNISAQQHIEDPDGNLVRTKQLNSRFAIPKNKLLRVWTA